jgi:uncharacterized lipoprotein YddW (UPF0748 family)
MKNLSVYIFTVVLISSILYSQSDYLKREFRGAWVATVANIDWPSEPGLSSGEMIEELTYLFDQLQSAGMNAVLFQIRTECDALYESNYEPWSFYITGTQGKAPEPFFDPLKFAINEAHKRGMELHAWFNPYRAIRKTGDYELSDDHVSITNPEYVLNFGEYQMLDPGLPGVQEHILNVMTDVLVNYDVDGIHFDDYFYPYDPKVSDEDAATFKKHNRGFTNIDDWRRDNINLLMRKIYQIVKAVKPHVKFGISPFGIVQNHYAGTDGFNSYDVLYCDPLTWLDEQIVDYINPQLYWAMEHELAPYSKLLPWWATVTNGRHLYIGQYSSRFAGEDYDGNDNELEMQIELNRKTENVNGSVFFSAKSISQNWSGLADFMSHDWYQHPAFPPVMPWKDYTPPNTPINFEAKKEGGVVFLNWDLPETAADGENANYFVLYKFEDSENDISDPSKIIFISKGNEFTYTDDHSQNSDVLYALTAMDRLHNESEPAIIKLK